MSDPAETQWRDAFLAVSAAIGEAHDDALASIDSPGASALAKALGDGERDTRARALAAAIARIVQDLDAMRLA